MNFIETQLKGAYVIEMTQHHDERGSFSRAFCANEFRDRGLRYEMVQSNLSKTLKRGTLRGMHFQVDGAEETKLVHCARGKLLDVIIDIRPQSETYCQHFKIELTEDNHRMLYVPEGFAHGFIILEDNSDAFYQVSQFYAPGKERGIRWNDPLFKISWPFAEPLLSPKDASHPNFQPQRV